MMKHLLALVLLPLALSAGPKPNVLLIVSDDQGYPDLGCIGTRPILTPNPDKLAAEGVRGTNFYVTWPACTPSRGSILTGRYPQRNGLYDMVRNDLVNYGYVYNNPNSSRKCEPALKLGAKKWTKANLAARSVIIDRSQERGVT